MPATVSPALQGALKDGFGEANVACDMPETLEFPSVLAIRNMENVPASVNYTVALYKLAGMWNSCQPQYIILLLYIG